MLDKFNPVVDSIFSHIHEAVLLVDKRGRVVYHNPVALELLGIDECVSFRQITESCGLNLRKAILKAGIDAGNEDAAARPSGEFMQFEERLCRDGVTRFLDVKTGAIESEHDPQGMRVILMKDITDHRRIEAVFRDSGSYGIVTNDPKMIEISAKLDHIAPTKASILLQGESGTGKTLIARMIHSKSNRADFPFVEVNCAAIPESLLESELFGHVKGAFTGAVQTRPGRFQAANHGTLFLDEISEIPIHLQSKLLKAIEEQAFQMVGSDKTVKVDVRVISASNQDLRDLVDNGRFRSDLYYRLAVIPIIIPPLRERPGDIPLLIKYFCDQLVARGYPDGIQCTKDTMGMMLDYFWPGNVRELVNAVEHGMILAEEKLVRPACLPQDIRRYSEHPDNGNGFNQIEISQREEIMDALRRSKGSKSEAARLLGVDRSTLWRRMQRLGLL
jgi:PAS domain S-box-containing protein